MKKKVVFYIGKGKERESKTKKQAVKNRKYKNESKRKFKKRE